MLDASRGMCAVAAGPIVGMGVVDGGAGVGQVLIGAVGVGCGLFLSLRGCKVNGRALPVAVVAA